MGLSKVIKLLAEVRRCPPHEVGQALANPSPWGEGSQNSCPLSFWERARVRVKSVLHLIDSDQNRFKNADRETSNCSICLTTVSAE